MWNIDNSSAGCARRIPAFLAKLFPVSIPPVPIPVGTIQTWFSWEFCSYYNTKSVLLCLGITALVCLSVTIFSFQSKVGPGEPPWARTGNWGELGGSGRVWMWDQPEGRGDVTGRVEQIRTRQGGTWQRWKWGWEMLMCENEIILWIGMWQRCKWDWEMLMCGNEIILWIGMFQGCKWDWEMVMCGNNLGFWRVGMCQGWQWGWKRLPGAKLGVLEGGAVGSRRTQRCVMDLGFLGLWH